MVSCRAQTQSPTVFTYPICRSIRGGIVVGGVVSIDFKLEFRDLVDRVVGGGGAIHSSPSLPRLKPETLNSPKYSASLCVRKGPDVETDRFGKPFARTHALNPKPSRPVFPFFRGSGF